MGMTSFKFSNCVQKNEAKLSSSVQFENDRVATDLENLEKSGNLKETSESQGICQKSH